MLFLRLKHASNSPGNSLPFQHLILPKAINPCCHWLGVKGAKSCFKDSGFKSCLSQHFATAKAINPGLYWLGVKGAKSGFKAGIQGNTCFSTAFFNHHRIQSSIEPLSLLARNPCSKLLFLRLKTLLRVQAIPRLFSQFSFCQTQLTPAATG